MTYAVLNPEIYEAALAGALGGMFADRGISSPVSSDYGPEVAIAQAWAQAVDTVWAATPFTPTGVACVQSASMCYWVGRNALPSQAVASAWRVPAAAIKAAAVEAGLSVASQGVTEFPLYLTGTTPGLAPNETVELAPFLILPRSAISSISYVATASGNAGAVGATITRDRLTVLVDADGVYAILGAGTAATVGTFAGVTITPTVAAGPDRIALTFSTSETPEASKVKARLSVNVQPF